MLGLEGEPGNFKVKVLKKPRYVDTKKCTSCGECAKVCPIELPDEYNSGLSKRKAIYKKYAQAIPGAYAIDKRGTAPCKATCPAHVSIQGYIALINQGKYREALELFKQDHPFPGVCGRVCHHPCEGECTRKDVDKSLGIRGLHRFLADYDMSSGEMFVPEVKEKRDEKVAIVGAGPAGLSCAYFLALRGYQVTVFEKLPVAGGMMAVGIPEYRLPRDILNKEVEIIQKMGVEFKFNTTFGKDITIDSLKKDGYRAVFLALGLHKSRKLNIEGEDLPDILPGVDFLRDVALKKEVKVGKRVVVIGGGNVAIDVALCAKRVGAEEVKMVCLEKRDEMPAWDYEIEEALEEGVEIINSYGPKRFIGDGSVEKVEFKKCTSVFDEDGRFNPKYDETDLIEVEADTVIVAIGQMGDFEDVKEQGVEVRAGLYADPVTLVTNVDGVFAGGDCFYGPKSVVDAVGCGKEAAESIHRYINNLDLKENRDKKWDFVRPDIREERQIPRVEQKKIPVEERQGFKEINLGYTEEEAKKEAERCLKCGVCSECYQCVKACLAGAINHEEKEEILELEVGSLVLSAGANTFDPSKVSDLYNYLDHPNVMTSLEFERILSASGPTMGHLLRPSDNTAPKKIAWLQCVGSRDENRCKNGYCSSVCCMYAIKEAMVAKEHQKGDLECVIFNMDIRTFGKDYEKYYIRGEEKEGIKFVKARVHTVFPVPGSDDLKVTYVTEDGEVKEDIFNMVVLSVGLEPSEEVVSVAQRLGIELNEHNFVKSDPLNPVATSKPGVFVSGIMEGPKDIPTSVSEASAAACAAGRELAKARWTRTKTLEIPEERDISKEEPRVGVFVCNCGINIGGIVNVDEVEKYAKSLPYVKFAMQNLFTCSEDAQEKIKEAIIEHKLNRIVVASCTPKTHENIFMNTIESVGLNKYLFEMANIRNQNSWVHSKTPKEATEKAKELVRMAVARAVKLFPLHDQEIPVTPSALVVGGGVGGMNAALALADNNFDVYLVEKEAELGGFAKNLVTTIEGVDVQKYVRELIAQVEKNPRINVYKASEVIDFSGYKGNFKTRIKTKDGEELEIDHGAIIIATGAKEYNPKEYYYGESDKVVTQVELSKIIKEKDIQDIKNVVMIQCIGSRNEQNPNCSRICCQSAIKNALHIKEKNKEANVYILYRDIRTYGYLEKYYTKARKAGVIFIRYDKNNMPEVVKDGDNLTVKVLDKILGREIIIDTDILALSAGVEANDTSDLANLMKIQRNPEGFFMEAHVKLRPVDMQSDGVYLCGTAHGPKLLSETIAQSFAAASRAITILSQPNLTLSAITAKVDQSKCAACLICVRTCPYGVPRINEEGVSEIDPALCHGCGVCAAECPAKAIQLNWYEDDQILAEIDALLEEVI